MKKSLIPIYRGRSDKARNMRPRAEKGPRKSLRGFSVRSFDLSCLSNSCVRLYVNNTASEFLISGERKKSGGLVYVLTCQGDFIGDFDNASAARTCALDMIRKNPSLLFLNDGCDI